MNPAAPKSLVGSAEAIGNSSTKYSGRLRHVWSTSQAQLLAILFVTLLLCWPCLMRGLPNGYDAPTHIGYQHHFSQQFWDGEWYPRWLARSNEGAGSPTFIIQYPLPYLVTAALRPLTSFAGERREARELGVFTFLCMLCAGVGSWFWLRQIAAAESATIAAIAYLGLPYVLGEALYVRAAVGELSALACMPVALACCEAMRKNKGATLALGVTFALLLLSNLINALMFVPLLIAYSFFSAREDEPPLLRTALRLGLAMLLGIGLAATYLVPFAAYRGLFDERQLFAYVPDFELGRYFVFLTWPSYLSWKLAICVPFVLILALFAARRAWSAPRPWIVRAAIAFALAAGLLAMVPKLGPAMIQASGLLVSSFDDADLFSQRMLLGMFASTLLAVIAFCQIRRKCGNRDLVLMAGTGISFMLMVPLAAWMWKAIPALTAFQFPFRFGAVLSICVAGLLALALDGCVGATMREQRRQCVLLLAATFGVFVIGAVAWRLDWRFRDPTVRKFDSAVNVDVNFRMYVDPSRLQSYADEIGAELRGYGVDYRGDFELRSGLSSGEGSITVRREGPRTLQVVADINADARVWIRQTYSPLWKMVATDGASSILPVRDSTRGMLEMQLPAGKRSFDLQFDGGAPEALGDMLSGFSLLVAGCAGLWLGIGHWRYRSNHG